MSHELKQALEQIDGLLTNLQPHIAQQPQGRANFIDNYVNPALKICRKALASASTEPPKAEPVAADEVRMAYKTGYDEGYSDASDGLVDHDACEEGWQQYLAAHPEQAEPKSQAALENEVDRLETELVRAQAEGAGAVVPAGLSDVELLKHWPKCGLGSTLCAGWDHIREFYNSLLAAAPHQPTDTQAAGRDAQVTPEMLRAAQTKSELGIEVCANMSGAYDLITKLYQVMHAAATKGKHHE